jgi:NAD-dependent deacetylase
MSEHGEKQPLASFAPALVNALRQARHIVVLTGAGISAESGIPTFRQAQTGLWARYDPAELATPDAFRANPNLVWEWYAWRRQLVSAAEPNAGHRALAALAGLEPQLTLITQNIDGLHQRAGSERVIELHGNLTRQRCFDEDMVVEAEPASTKIPPRCPRCGGLLRPDVVWFGESLPPDAWKAAVSASEQADVFMSIGTSAVVYPAADLPFAAVRRGALLVEIDPESTALSDMADYSLRGPAGLVLPTLFEAVWPGLSGNETSPP